MLVLDQVSKAYGSKKAVDGLSLTIARGEIFAFLGPNGAGKTTTIKMIVGLLTPAAGRIQFDGEPLGRDSLHLRRKLSYVPDQPYVYEKLTGREFLQFVRDVHALPAAEAEPLQASLIETFEMTPYVDDLAETYSHGMRQRLAFAAAFLTRPTLMVLDEPMVGLDPKSMRLVKDLLRQHADAGMTILMSTHTLALAEEIADRVGIIHRGRLLRCGTPNELRAELASQSTGSSAGPGEGEGAGSLEDYFLRVTADEGIYPPLDQAIASSTPIGDRAPRESSA